MSWQLATFALLAVALALGFAWYERSRPGSRTVALVATLAALATLGRLAFAPIPNVKPTTDIVLLAGYVLGGAPGFAVGATSAIVSNVIFGEGPWTPWQMLAWGLVGIGGALLAHGGRRIPRVPMAICCALAGFGFGLVVDLYQWTGYTDRTLGSYLATEASSFPFNLAHAVGNLLFYLAFGPALLRALQRYRLRLEVSWGPVTPMLLVLALGAGALAPARAGASAQASTASGRRALSAAAARAARAQVGYLLRVRNADGGFGGGTGAPSTQLFTAWAVIGLAAAGERPGRLSRSPVSWIEAHLGALSGAGDLERTILALAAAGADERPLVTRLMRLQRADGSFEERENTTAFAILALSAAHARIGTAAAWLAAHANVDGGFGLGSSDVDDTAAAIEALVVAGKRVATRTVRFLLAAEGRDGGFPLLPGGPSNAQSTAWAAQALIALHRTDAGALRYLLARTLRSGEVQYAAASTQTPVWVTAEALAAVLGRPLPVELAGEHLLFAADDRRSTQRERARRAPRRARA